MDFVDLRLYNAAGTSQTQLPYYQSLQFSDVFNDVGNGNFSYPYDNGTLPSGQTYSGALTLGLDEGSEIGVSTEAGEVGRILVENTGTSYAVDGTRLRTLSGRLTFAYIEDAVVHPNNWPVTIPAGHAFVNATPGNILRTLVARAVERGTLSTPAIDVSTFTGTTTSNGVAWAKTQTVNYSNGYTYLQVIQDMVSAGLIDVKMVGRSLRIYNNGFLSSTHISSFLFRRGQNMTEGSSSTDASEVGTVVLIEGDENVAIEVADSAAISAYRRREKYVSQGGITDSGTLTLIAQATLDSSKTIPEEFTIGVTSQDATTTRAEDPEPWVDYKPGDWVKYDRDGTIEELQIQQIALQVDANRRITVGLTVGTLLADAQMRLQRKIDAITGGNSGTYGPLPNPTTQDKTAPAAPSTVTVTSSAYTSPSGTPYAQVTVSWPQIQLNSDGTFCDDLEHYEVQTQVGTNAWQPGGTTQNLSTYFSQLPPGQSFKAQVRGVDTTGNMGAWRVSNTVTLAVSTTPPPTPSIPQLSNSVGSLYVVWDGNNSSGVVMPAYSFRYVEVHISTTSGFTPSSTTLKGTLAGAGLQKITPIVYGTTYYSKFVAVDWNAPALRSTASAQASLTPGGVGPNDIVAGAITSDKIAAGAITTDKLAAGSITTATLAANAITGQTITGGTISIGGGTFMVNALGALTATSATITGGSISIGGSTFMVDAAGALTATSATITGTIRTALTGVRLEILSGATNTIYMYSDDISAEPAALYNLFDTNINDRANFYIYSGNNPVYQRRAYITAYSGSPTIAQAEGILLNSSYVSLGVVPGNPSGRTAISGSNNARFVLSPGADPFQWFTTNMDRLTLGPQGAGTAPHFNNTSNSSGVTFGNSRIFIENASGTARPISASGFTTVSSREAKSNIQDLPYTGLDMLMAAPISKWQYTGDDTETWHVSPMAEDLPMEVLDVDENNVPHIEINSLLGLLWQAVRELNTKVEGLSK